MKFLGALLLACLTVACTSVAPTRVALAAEHPEARPYDETRDATADVNATLAEATTLGKHAIIVMGANWCHDSRALAGWFETERFRSLLSENFVVRYVDVGQKDRNIDIAQRFGIGDIVGTPTVIVTDTKGTVLNLETAPTWRNAASRDEDAIYAYFSGFVSKTTEN